VEAAGFKLAGKSEVNTNPKDTKDYPEGVWSLPPTYEEKDKNKEKYAAIGESDRMTLKFTKVAPKAAAAAPKAGAPAAAPKPAAPTPKPAKEPAKERHCVALADNEGKVGHVLTLPLRFLTWEARVLG
jgi:hypothetical protein